MGAVQLALPEMARPRRRSSRPRRSRSHTRVWSDPAVLQAEADAGHQFETWRRALATFLRRLPAERRAELRARIAGSTPASRLTVPDAS